MLGGLPATPNFFGQQLTPTVGPASLGSPAAPGGAAVPALAAGAPLGTASYGLSPSAPLGDHFPTTPVLHVKVGSWVSRSLRALPPFRRKLEFRLSRVLLLHWVAAKSAR